MADRNFASDIERIYHLWHERARARDLEGLLSLYAEEAVLESPLVAALLKRESGVLRGHGELRNFLRMGAEKFFQLSTDKRPNAVVRWHSSQDYFTNGRTLVWEYPRATPEGDQIEIVEAMDLMGGRISHHRIYWGWLGASLLVKNALAQQG